MEKNESFVQDFLSVEELADFPPCFQGFPAFGMSDFFLRTDGQFEKCGCLLRREVLGILGEAMQFARLLDSRCERVQMRFSCLMLVWLAGVLLPMAARAEFPQAEAGKSRVLILGDSISIGYTPEVQALLKDEAFVARPMGKNKRAENCAGTNNGIKHIDRWLKMDGSNWDVVHFNFGLHDLKHVDAKSGQNSNDPQDPEQAPPAVYEKQLREIVKKLKATKAKLIFATTTPVPAGDLKPYRNPADVEKYNAIAKKIMEENGVAIDDLYAFANPRLKEIQRSENVHFTPAGSKLLAKEVVKSIRLALNTPASSLKK